MDGWIFFNATKFYIFNSWREKTREISPLTTINWLFILRKGHYYNIIITNKKLVKLSPNFRYKILLSIRKPILLKIIKKNNL